MSNLKSKALDMLCTIEGYHQRLKEIHWSTTNNAEHKLVDEIDEEVLSYEDKIAEAAMGCINARFEIGSLKTLLPEAKNTASLLSEMLNDVLAFRKVIEQSNKCVGIVNIIDDFITDINSWNYMRTFF